MGVNLGYLGSKTRSLSRFKEIPYGRFKGNTCCSIDLKICQNVCLDETLDQF